MLCFIFNYAKKTVDFVAFYKFAAFLVVDKKGASFFVNFTTYAIQENRDTIYEQCFFMSLMLIGTQLSFETTKSEKKYSVVTSARVKVAAQMLLVFTYKCCAYT